MIHCRMITFRFSRFAEGWTLYASASGEPERGCDSGGERGSAQSERVRERKRERERDVSMEEDGREAGREGQLKMGAP